MNYSVDGFACGTIQVSHPYGCVRPECERAIYRFCPVEVGAEFLQRSW